AERRLAELPTGGRTPLGHGVQLALETIERHLASWPDALPLLVLVSDGRANVPLGAGDPMAELAQLGQALDRRRVHRLLVDTDQGAVRFGFAAEVAGALGARHVPIAELAARPLVGLVRETVSAGWGRA
ncbi:MAG: magnesium chelatase, partial [Chloroflexi bacterium]|nr:magnesium chelatase [Chloroflexota bacterium]